MPVHYIKTNDSARIPQRLIVVDVQSSVHAQKSGETHGWGCASVVYTNWTKKGTIMQEVKQYTDVELLWKEVGEFTRAKRRTVLYMHNVPYAFVVSQGLRWLPVGGWELARIRVDSRGSWSKWSREGATLCIADVASVFPVQIQTLAKTVGLRALASRPELGTDYALKRSERAVEIMGKVMLQYFEWLRSGAAGNWQITGAGQAWAHWRHNFYTHKILVHQDAEAREMERAAMYCGRSEAYRWGRDISAPIYEYDWSSAYPRIARDADVPTRLLSETGRMPIQDFLRISKRHAVLAECEITTEVECVPTRIDGRIVWPVGKFTSVLWGPEIELLCANNAHVYITRARVYAKEPALATWAEHILHPEHEAAIGYLRWIPLVYKHWSRALIGRFATRYQEWELFGKGLPARLCIGTMLNTRDNTTTETLQVGDTLYTLAEYSDGENSAPQITGYIMSLARVKLWEAMVTVGRENVLYCDTDSLIVNARGKVNILKQHGEGIFDGLIEKGRHRGYEIFGPQQAVIGNTYKLSGIPRNARRVTQTTWDGEVWSSLQTGLKSGVIDSVRVTAKRFTATYRESRRIRGTDGTTAAIRLG
ncbi:MAG: DNA polymerase [Candidatus Dormibacteria bacterium]